MEEEDDDADYDDESDYDVSLPCFPSSRTENIDPYRQTSLTRLSIQDVPGAGDPGAPPAFPSDEDDEEDEEEYDEEDEEEDDEVAENSAPAAAAVGRKTHQEVLKDFYEVG